MKFIGLALASLGIWVIVNSFVAAIWDDIAFGAITVVLGILAMLKQE